MGTGVISGGTKQRVSREEVRGQSLEEPQHLKAQERRICLKWRQRRKVRNTPRKECGVWGLPGSPVVSTPRSHCQEPGFSPGWGTKIPQAVQRSQKKQKTKQNRMRYHGKKECFKEKVKSRLTGKRGRSSKKRTENIH